MYVTKEKSNFLALLENSAANLQQLKPNYCH